METMSGVNSAPSYQVVEYKYCEDCGGRFLRVLTPLKRFKAIRNDRGKVIRPERVIDPNKFCSLCERSLVESMDAHTEELESLKNDPLYGGMMRGDLRNEKVLHSASQERMLRECLRKDAFYTMQLAQKVAKRQRRTNDNALGVYICRALIDPEQHPDRSKPHYHIGGNTENSLKKKFKNRRY